MPSGPMPWPGGHSWACIASFGRACPLRSTWKRTGAQRHDVRHVPPVNRLQ
ncbi:MAG: hypothetical protein ACFFGP_15180 [Promethearchaeota archaeon]